MLSRLAERGAVVKSPGSGKSVLYSASERLFNIYYLMRREVDATDLDDVYLEQTDDEFADPVSADTPSTGAAAVVVEKAEVVQTDVTPTT